MKSSQILGSTLLALVFSTTSCTKSEESPIEENIDGTYLQFSTTTGNEQNDIVLYSNWVKTEFPKSSNFGSVQWHLPYIPNELLNLDQDLVLIFAKRNHLFQLPMTAPTSNEHYTTDFGKYPKGILASVRVYAYNWQTEPLNDIFFGTNTEAMFRVVIVPGEKMFELSSSNSIAIESFTYEELASRFNIPDGL